MTDRESRIKLLMDGPKLFDLGNKTYYKRTSHLPVLIDVYWRTECSDPRDKVYALFNILPEKELARSLEIDHSISAAQLFVRIVELLHNSLRGMILRSGSN
jgi:hypothetical protein